MLPWASCPRDIHSLGKTAEKRGLQRTESSWRLRSEKAHRGNSVRRSRSACPSFSPYFFDVAGFSSNTASLLGSPSAVPCFFPFRVRGSSSACSMPQKVKVYSCHPWTTTPWVGRVAGGITRLDFRELVCRHWWTWWCCLGLSVHPHSEVPPLRVQSMRNVSERGMQV